MAALPATFSTLGDDPLMAYESIAEGYRRKAAHHEHCANRARTPMLKAGHVKGYHDAMKMLAMTQDTIRGIVIAAYEREQAKTAMLQALADIAAEELRCDDPDCDCNQGD